MTVRERLRRLWCRLTDHDWRIDEVNLLRSVPRSLGGMRPLLAGALVTCQRCGRVSDDRGSAAVIRHAQQRGLYYWVVEGDVSFSPPPRPPLRLVR